VLSWNIAFGKGTDGITNYDRIATWLARMNPDLIALCEVPPDSISTLVTALNQKTGRTWNNHFVPKAPGIAEGNLILSKYSFVAVGSSYLSYTRSIAQATVNVGGKNINFFATHLDHTSSSLRSTEAARRKTSFSVQPALGRMVTTLGFPSVRVPVLSMTTVSTFSNTSRDSAFRIRIPAFAPRPPPTMTAIGVASPTAHGQAMIRTAIAFRSA
jgi:endonuclease/exonuclease/phosphatase family metal-dependent hydrolase